MVYEPSFDEVLLFDEPAAEISRHFQRIYAKWPVGRI